MLKDILKRISAITIAGTMLAGMITVPASATSNQPTVGTSNIFFEDFDDTDIELGGDQTVELTVINKATGEIVGEGTTNVKLTWDKLPNADLYFIKRNGEEISEVNDMENPFYIDENMPTSQIYNYEVVGAYRDGDNVIKSTFTQEVVSVAVVDSTIDTNMYPIINAPMTITFTGENEGVLFDQRSAVSDGGLFIMTIDVTDTDLDGTQFALTDASGKKLSVDLSEYANINGDTAYVEIPAADLIEANENAEAANKINFGDIRKISITSTEAKTVIVETVDYANYRVPEVSVHTADGAEVSGTIESPDSIVNKLIVKFTSDVSGVAEIDASTVSKDTVKLVNGGSEATIYPTYTSNGLEIFIPDGLKANRTYELKLNGVKTVTGGVVIDTKTVETGTVKEKEATTKDTILNHPDMLDVLFADGYYDQAGTYPSTGQGITNVDKGGTYDLQMSAGNAGKTPALYSGDNVRIYKFNDSGNSKSVPNSELSLIGMQHRDHDGSNNWSKVHHVDLPNTFSAYLDGQLVLEDKPFVADGDVFSNWYGFSKITIGETALNSTADALYIDDFKYGIDNTVPVNSVVDSTNPYYVNLIDNTKGVIYDGGQDFADFASKMRTDGISDAQFVNSNSYLKMKDAKGGYIYYNVAPLSEKPIASGDSIDNYSVEGINVNDQKYNPDLTNYYEYEQPISIKADSALDASFTLGNAATIDANGFVYADGDRFMLDMNTPDDKSDDKEIKFWGVNVGGKAAFPDTYEEAERTADSVAKAGFNLVRFHRIDGDSSPSLFGFSNDATKLDEVFWDKFCYLVKCLKDRGIYYYVDQMVGMPSRIYKNGVGSVSASGLENVDKLGNGLKPICYFDDTAIKLQKEFSKMLLTTKNPHTNMSFAEDPAMALIDLKNEFSFQHFSGWFTETDDGLVINETYKPYYEELCTQYAKWLSDVHYKEYISWGSGAVTTDSQLAEAWGSGYYPLTYGGITDSASDKVHFFRDANYAKHRNTDPRLNDEELFIKYMMAEYFTEMITYLEDIGVKCAVTGNTVYGDMQVQIAHDNAINTDFVDIHMYWGHPSLSLTDRGSDLAVYNFVGQTNVKAGNVSMLEASAPYTSNNTTSLGGLGSLSKLASARIEGKPYVISEWLSCAGTTTHAEGPLLISAFSSMHNWNPISFAWLPSSSYYANLEDGDTINLDSPFSMIENPVMRALYPAAAIMFNRGDVKEAEVGVYTTYTKESDVYIAQGKDSNGKQVWLGGHFFPDASREALLGKTGIKYYDVASDSETNTAIEEEAQTKRQNELQGNKETYTSNTDELVTDLENYIFKVNTDRSQAVSGYIGGKTVETDKNLKLDVTNNFATVMLTSLTDSPISSSQRILLSVAGNTRNHGQVLTEDGKYVKIGSDNTILTEQIVGTVTLKNMSGTYKAYALTPSGDRKAEIPVTQNGDSSISIILTKATKAMNIEFVKQ